MLDRQDDDTLTMEELDGLEQICQVNCVISALKARSLAGGESGR